jgi:gluconate 2-dehydrogenase alpha chain
MVIRHRKVDVVTVGAGLTSNILGWKLTEAGMEVVAVEQGPWRWADPDFTHNHDSLRYSVRKAMMNDLERETWTWRPTVDAPSLPLRQYGAFHPGQGVGGSMVHWSGMLWRFTEYDFNYRSYYVDRYGEDRLPEGSSNQDWPVTYDEMEPYFAAFEQDIGASGRAGNIGGEIQEGGNPFESPRSAEYPLPPLDVTIPSDMFASACEQLGYHPFPQPSGILSRAYTDPFGNTRAGCIYCGFCTRYGCEVDAKSTGLTTYLPVALRTGKYEVRAHSRVTGVTLGADGLATGITYVDIETGEEHEQPADIVVLSGYTLGNVKLLLLSRSAEHPDGIGNDRGQVGRNATYQIWDTPATGVFSGQRYNLFAGNTSTIQVIHDFYGHVIDHGPLDFIGGSSVFSTLGEREPVTSAGDLPINGDQDWGQPFKDALRDHWDGFVPITIQGESPAYEQHFFDLDPVYKDAFGLPLLRMTFDWMDNERRLYRYMAERCREIVEEMGPDEIKFEDELEDFNIHDYQSTHINGGAIMGSDPGNSVTNSYGQVWDTPNVFVTGATLFPQNPAANPSDMVAALAYRTGDAIRDKYVKDPEQIIS